MSYQLMSFEKFTNIQKAQSGLTRIFKDAEKNDSFYRIMRNDEPLGVLVPNDVWENLLEDLEALSSQSYLLKIHWARKSQHRHTSKQVKQALGIN